MMSVRVKATGRFEESALEGDFRNFATAAGINPEFVVAAFNKALSDDVTSPGPRNQYGVQGFNFNELGLDSLERSIKKSGNARPNGLSWYEFVFANNGMTIHDAHKFTRTMVKMYEGFFSPRWKYPDATDMSEAEALKVFARSNLRAVLDGTSTTLNYPVGTVTSQNVTPDEEWALSLGSSAVPVVAYEVAVGLAGIGQVGGVTATFGDLALWTNRGYTVFLTQVDRQDPAWVAPNGDVIDLTQRAHNDVVYFEAVDGGGAPIPQESLPTGAAAGTVPYGSGYGLRMYVAATRMPSLFNYSTAAATNVIDGLIPQSLSVNIEYFNANAIMPTTGRVWTTIPAPGELISFPMETITFYVSD